MSRELARYLANLGADMRTVHPDIEAHQMTDIVAGRAIITRNDWPAEQKISVPFAGHATEAATGGCDVGYQSGSRQQPFVFGGGLSRHFGSPPFPSVLLDAMWGQAEANPYCNRVARDHQAPPTWQSEAGAHLIGSLPRYYYGDALQIDSLTGSFNRLISHEGVVLGETTVAAMVSLFNADCSAIVGYLVREWELGTETVFEWIHLLTSTIGTIPTNNAQRRQGYLFFDRQSNSYTVACPQGLLLCTHANAPTPTCCNWAHSYGNIPPESSVSVASGYALQGAWIPYDAAFDSLSTHGAVDCYVRGMSAWAHAAQVQLGNKLSGCDYLDGCGEWDPFATVSDYWEGAENTRWPYLAASQEWLGWITGTAGDRAAYRGITKASAALVAIKASSGAVRVVQAYDAPLLKVPAFEEALADFEERLTYQSTPHPENWVFLPYPVNNYYDNGGSRGWSGGAIRPGPIGEGTFTTSSPAYPDLPVTTYSGGDIPEADLGYGHWNHEWVDLVDVYGVPYHELRQTTWVPGSLPSSNDGPGSYDAGRDTQYLDVYAGWADDRDPTVAGKSQRLISPFPRGIVDKDAKCYEFVWHNEWQSGETPGFTPSSPWYDPGGSTWTYAGYEDTTAIPGMDGHITRIYKRVRTVHGTLNWENNFDRLILRQYNGTGLLSTLDLTREFPYVDEAGKHRITYQHPDVIDWIGAGDYLWVLASDWWAADSQKLSLILINKTSLLEVARIDLSPGTGRLWLIETDYWGSGGRPQLWGGVDATGEPWAQVAAWWSGSTESLIQEVRYVSSALTKSTLCNNALQDATTQPSRLTAVANVAIEPGSQFWIDSGSQVKRLNS